MYWRRTKSRRQFATVTSEQIMCTMQQSWRTKWLYFWYCTILIIVINLSQVRVLGGPSACDGGAGPPWPFDAKPALFK